MGSDALVLAVPIAGAMCYLLRTYAKQAALLTAAVIASSTSATNSLSSLASSMAKWSSRPCLLQSPEGADPRTASTSNPGAPDHQQEG